MGLTILVAKSCANVVCISTNENFLSLVSTMLVSINDTDHTYQKFFGIQMKIIKSGFSL